MAIAITPVTAANANFGPLGSAAWDAGMQITGTTVANALLYLDSSKALAQSANLTFDGSTFTLGAGTITTDLQQLLTTVTRNNAGTAFGAAWKLVITDTASASGSLVVQVLGGASASTQLFAVDKNGTFSSVGLSTGSIQGSTVKGSTYFWQNSDGSAGVVLGSAGDINFSRISSTVIGLGNGSAGSFANRLKLTSAIHAGVAIGSLNASPTQGEIQSVTDSLNPVIGSTVSSGGAAAALVWWNGANWTVIGK